MNITIDDTSPQITFHSDSDGWITNHQDDPLLSQYFGATFHATTKDGDYMNINFIGTAIYVYGAYRNNHGIYSTQLDSGKLGYKLGYSKDDLIQQVLFVARGLDMSMEHSLTITNLPLQTVPPANATVQYFLDIDYIVITMPKPETIYTTLYDDYSPAIEFTGFRGYANDTNGYYNKTNHLSNTGSSTARLTFDGTSIQVFGGTNFDPGDYSVNLDGGAAQVFNGTSDNLHVGTSLFIANNLTEGRHNIQLTNLGSAMQNAFDVDYIVVNSTVAPTLGNNVTNTTTGSSGPVNPSTGTQIGNQQADSRSALSGGAIGGIAGGIVALGLVGFFVWFFFIRKKRGQGKGEPYKTVDLNGSPIITSMALDGGEVEPFPPSLGYFQYGSTSLRSTNNMAQERDASNGSFFNMVPPASPPDAMSYPHSVAAPIDTSNRLSAYTALASSTDGASGQHDVSPVALVSNSRSSAMPFTPSAMATIPSVPTQTQRATPVKSPRATLPFTANHPPQDVIALEALDRITVPGREVDFGPAPLSPTPGLLPPDYHQATQPLPGQVNSR